ncbi:MAG: tRNA (adenosine(37)-N6)-threonylcarbamoyltransferase complex transferase subunit TsaD [Bacteroidota bacterium]
MSTHILAIESSCDETAAALFVDHRLLSERVASQGVHQSYGGVVPELASRAHLTHIVPVVDQVLKEGSFSRSQLTHIAFTQGPGLMGALLVGTCFAQGLALALELPLIPVHHIKAHLFANYITAPYPKLPFLGLVVSGGHTQLVWVERYDKVTLLGETLDDAAGEAFDKIAKLLGFPYPGGAHIDRHAQEGDAETFSFPITRLPKLNFSFSGIKTAVLYFLRKEEKKNANFVEKHLHDLCASVQHAIVTMLIEKVGQAIEETGSQQLVVGGGVAANSELKKRLYALTQEKGCELFIPPIHHCQDNAAMIGITAYHQLQQGIQPIKGAYQEPMARMTF